jgi:alpha-1,2-mannosyltransferase
LAGAAFLAGAVLIKVFPLSLLAYYAWRGRWKFVSATLVAVLAGTLVLPAMVFGWNRNIEYLREFKHAVVDPATMSEAGRSHYEMYDQLLSLGKPRNQALAPVLYRFFGGEQTPLISVLVAVILGGGIWFAMRGAKSASENLVLGAALIWMLLVSPVAEDHYYAMLLLPAAYVVAEVESAPKSARKRLGIIALVIYGVVNFSAMLGHPFEYYGVVCWAALLLLALTFYLVRTTEPPVFSGQTSISEAV